ncbi:MAG TPA: prenyltransferase/squalene oxidase repeat-containing protein, partial [Planctomycetota bacterium]|nr:prenyltransferase/squalene oxidase repeat-containing protein [Planctomycetota bacterium]
VMALAAAGRRDHEVTRRGVAFLVAGVRDDGSWPIDTNLSTWVTTQSVEALAHAGPLDRADDLRAWLLDQQHREVHPYTDSPPGGWAWTNLSGGVPDVDDTSGALIALAHLGGTPDVSRVHAALRWLVDLQNSDGGWPTFCRGWGKLAFDRSAPDLAAHAVRAIRLWHGGYHPAKERRAVRRALDYLRRTQQPDGAWTPLWFGNQFVMDHANPVYGTARVLAALRDLALTHDGCARRAVTFLLDVQNDDDGWGGARDVPSTLEETALAVRALAETGCDPRCADAVARGCRFLVDHISSGELAKPAPIGLYFASLWYSEKLYPVVWSVAALGSVLSGADARTSRPGREKRS